MSQVLGADDVLNGSMWLCKYPQCWTLTAQWLENDQWVLLDEPDPNGARMAHKTGLKVILTRYEVADFLSRMEARRLNYGADGLKE